MHRTRGTHLALPVLALAAGLLAACSESPVMPEDLSPQFARPPAPDVFPSRFTIPASGPGVFGDGLGDYVDGVCGVGARIGTNTSTNNLVAILNLPQSPAPGCSLRTVTLRLASQHLGLNPDGSHNDVPGALAGDYPVNSSITIGETGAGTVNSNICLHRGKNGRYTGAGMRFWSAGYPGSNDLVVTISAPGYWHVTSQPYPDNVAYCDGDNGTTYWHIDVDLNVAPK